MTTTSMSLPREAAPVADRRLATLAAMAAVYVIWGSTYLVVRIAIRTVPPLLMGGTRIVIAGAIMMVIGRARGLAMPTRRQWWSALPVGLCLFVGGNGAVVISETRVSSGIVALVCATMPLWMAVFSTAAGERSTRREWLGVAMGVAGVVILCSGAELAATPLYAAIACASPMAWALGSVFARRLPQASGVMAAATQQLLGGAAMLAVGLVRGERFPAAIGFEAVWSIAYLIVLGSLIGFSAYAWLLRHARPAVATSYAFVNPVLAVLLGVMFGAESLHGATLVATPLIIAAVVLVVRRK